MEGGTASEVSATDPTIVADMELVRIAFPRKVFTLSQAMYALDRLQWLYDNRELLGPMAYEDIPGMVRCFRTPLKPLTDWPEKLIAKYKEDLGER
jgi:tryptophanase